MASSLVPGTSKTGEIDPAGSITMSTGTTLKPGYVSSITPVSYTHLTLPTN